MDEGELPFGDDPKTVVLRFCAALAAGWFLDLIGIGLMMQLTFHEFGHAVAAWLGGRWAIPIPIAALTFVGRSRSTFVTVFAGAGLAWLAKYNWDKKRLWLAGSATCALTVLVLFAFLSDKDVEMWWIFGGVAGEMLLSCLCLCAYFWDVSEEWRWDFWRYPVAVAAACAWLQSASLWFGANIGLAGWSMRAEDAAVTHNPRAYIEWLSNTPGGNDQDAYRLVHTHGWTGDELAAAHRSVAVDTLAIIILVVGIYLLFPERRDIVRSDP